MTFNNLHVGKNILEKKLFAKNFFKMKCAGTPDSEIRLIFENPGVIPLTQLLAD